MSKKTNEELIEQLCYTVIAKPAQIAEDTQSTGHKEATWAPYLPEPCVNRKFVGLILSKLSAAVRGRTTCTEEVRGSTPLSSTTQYCLPPSTHS